MQPRRREAVAAAVDRSCRSDLDAIRLQRAVAEALAPAVPFDRWCAMSLDPATGLPAGGFHAEGLPIPTMPRLLELEFGEESDARPGPRR